MRLSIMKTIIRPGTALGKTLGLALFIISLSGVTAHAGMYKYIDEDGNVSYSQTPPPSGDYKSIKLPKEATRSHLTKKERDAARQKSRDSIMGKTIDGEDPASDTRAGANPDKAEEKLVRDEARKNKNERKDLCKQARESKNKLEVYRRFRDKDGNVIRYSDEERAKRLSNANEAIKQFCS